MASVLDFGVKGDGKTDNTQALHHALQHCDGALVFPRGDYLITRPLYIPLEVHGRVHLSGMGGTARLLMNGPGPALHLVGTHRKSALPAHFDEKVWSKERFPTVQGLEIVGQHASADGIRVEGAMQPTLVNLLIRHCRHGIHLISRDRNVLVADCHIYDNTGVGIYFDRVNLHQTNIHGNHISYCKQGGIKIAGSEIRNLQICSNDIEYNHDLMAKTSADVYLDCREGTVREGTLVGNTIQAVLSPGGANVRLEGVGKGNNTAVGLFAITGNLIGSQETAIHLRACRGVVISGNCVYSGYRYSLLAEDSEHMVVSGNSIDHNPEYRGQSTDQVVLRRCRNVNLHGLLLQHTREGEGEVEASMDLSGCENVTITGCQIIDARKRGIQIQDCQVLRVSDSTIRPREGDRSYHSAVKADAKSSLVMVTNNFVGKGSEGDVVLPARSGTASGNAVL